MYLLTQHVLITLLLPHVIMVTENVSDHHLPPVAKRSPDQIGAKLTTITTILQNPLVHLTQ
jgi:hypothetical protein